MTMLSDTRLSAGLLLVALTAWGLTACGGDSSAAGLTPAEAAGRATYLDKGCAACHGSDGGGQVGPSLIGLIGSERAFENAEPLIADRDYLIESIREPSAKTVAGYSLPMPRVELTDAELESIVAYIEALTAAEDDS